MKQDKQQRGGWRLSKQLGFLFLGSWMCSSALAEQGDGTSSESLTRQMLGPGEALLELSYGDHWMALNAWEIHSQSVALGYRRGLRGDSEIQGYVTKSQTQINNQTQVNDRIDLQLGYRMLLKRQTTTPSVFATVGGMVPVGSDQTWRALVDLEARQRIYPDHIYGGIGLMLDPERKDKNTLAVSYRIGTSFDRNAQLFPTIELNGMRRGGSEQRRLFLGLAWTAGQKTQLKVGVSLGLTPQTPDSGLSIGLTWGL